MLSDAIHSVYVELSKLNEILKKSVDDMTDLEKWTVFFRYASNPKYRETVNNVIESKEALQMAANLLMSVSQDEHERAIFRRELTAENFAKATKNPYFEKLCLKTEVAISRDSYRIFEEIGNQNGVPPEIIMNRCLESYAKELANDTDV